MESQTTPETGEDLAAFLLARLAEDEALARGAEGGKGPHGYFAVTDWAYVDRDFGDLLPARRVNDSNAWSPARVLAEVAAKRRIIERYAETEKRADSHIRNGLSSEPDDEVAERLALEWCCWMLSLPYAGHADYREGWKP